MRHTLDLNLQRVRARIDDAAKRAGRPPPGIELVAVTKSVGPALAAELALQGCLDLGESRADELLRKAAWFEEHRVEARWHFLGHLQRNKARRVVERAFAIHSVDSIRLLETIARLAQELGRSPELYLEVKLAGDADKTGLAPGDLRAAVESARRIPGAGLCGLMTIAPLLPGRPDAERRAAARTAFGELARLARDLAREAPMRDAFRLGKVRLSMGMSGDFEEAIDAGADVVRVGTALFEGLSSGVDSAGAPT